MNTKSKLSQTAHDQRYWRKRMDELTFGQIIRAHRLAEEWSLTDTAQRIGISKQQLSDYESGRKLPSIEKAYKIAKSLDMMPRSAVLQVINEHLREAQIPIKVQEAS